MSGQPAARVRWVTSDRDDRAEQADHEVAPTR